MNEPTTPPANRPLDVRSMIRLLVPAVAVVLAYVAWQLAPSWISVAWSSIPRETRQAASVGFLHELLGAYVALLVAVLLTLPVLGLFLARPRPGARRTKGTRGWLPRLLLLDFSLLLSILAVEAVSAAWLRWLHRAPASPAAAAIRREEDALNPRIRADLANAAPDGSSGADKGPLKILVIGESSGRGEPYHPWLSAGQIAGWKLEEVLHRRVELDIWATGGAILEGMHQQLSELTYRPDALIVFSGHNEFQGRWAWDRNSAGDAPEGRAEAPERPAWQVILGASPACRLIIEAIEHQRIDVMPPKVITRQLIDRPLCTPAERARILADFGRRADAIATIAEQIHSLPIFFIPASNDGGYEPSRSILPATTPEPVRVAFDGDVRRARELEKTDQAGAISAYRRLIAAQPGFAETHFRLARLLESAGSWDEARREYVLARESDALPLRCPEDFRDAYRKLASRHPSLILVDCDKVLTAISPHGILDDHLYHDAQHPTLRGYIALAQDLLKQLHDRHALGWPEGTPMPVVDPEACARHFGLDPERWASVCGRSAWFYGVTAFTRYDPAERQAKEAAYRKAAEKILAGARPEDAGITGLGIRPAGIP
ncbi:tetratricopeptide repeat protein [Aquisphaera insulae]|uniref:tetratricopeptide repeat protein n=1 Tax=Aquisphaera insulae TaxID=2712864 RepID=UPI0013EA9925|nr:tetratricopeptide repeat protein [Aquisphaera insulae]